MGGLTALSIDPFVLAETNPSAMLNGHVVLTMIDGEVAFQQLGR